MIIKQRSMCCGAPLEQDTFQATGGYEIPQFSCSKCHTAAIGRACLRCSNGENLFCSEPCDRFDPAIGHEHHCPDCGRTRVIKETMQNFSQSVPTAPSIKGPMVTFPLAELMKPKILVLIESTDGKHFAQIKLTREQYGALERLVGCDQESVNRAIMGGGELPLILTDKAVPGAQFERMKPYE